MVLKIIARVSETSFIKKSDFQLVKFPQILRRDEALQIKSYTLKTNQCIFFILIRDCNSWGKHVSALQRQNVELKWVCQKNERLWSIDEKNPKQSRDQIASHFMKLWRVDNKRGHEYIRTELRGLQKGGG